MILFTNSYLNRFQNKIPVELKNFVILSFSNAFNHAIRLFTGVINARFLTPHLYGINTFTSTLSRYINYTQLGAQSGLNRQIPIDVGSKNESNTFINLMSVFWLLVFISFLILIITTIFFFGSINFTNLPKSYLYEAAGISITSLFSAYFTSYLVSIRNYTTLSKLKIVVDTGLTLVTVLLVYFFKLHGLFIGIIVAQIIFSIVTIYKVNFKISLIFSFLHLKTLIIAGFPIMLGSFVYVFFSTIDFVFLIKHITPFLLGIYGFALTGVAAFRIYSTSLSDILSPKMGVLYGANNQNPFVLFEFIKKYNEIFMFSLGALAIIYYLFIPDIIKCFLPDYIQSVEPFKMLLLGSIGLAIYIPSGISITILRKNNIYTIILSVFSLITYSIFVFFIKTDFIYYVPKVLFIMSTLFSLSIIFIASYFTSGKFKFVFLGKQIMSLFIILIVIHIVDKLSILNQFNGTVFITILDSVIKIIIGEIIIIGYLIIRYKKTMIKLISNKYD